MPIATRCPTCGKDYNLADEQAGLRVRCRQCENEFDVPRRPELLEAVAPAPTARLAPLSPETDPLALALKTPPPRRRTLYYVLGGIGGGILLMVLACTGLGWLLWTKLQSAWPKTQVVEIRVTESLPKVEVKEVPKPAPAPKEKEIDLSQPEKVLGPAPKDLDDALKQLQSPDWKLRLRAIQYIGKQKPQDHPTKQKAVLDALDKATNDDSSIVKLAAAYAKIPWGGYD
jgi:hypothetical protein